MIQMSGSDILTLDTESLYLTMVDYNPLIHTIFAWGMTRSYNGELIEFDVTVESD